MNAYRLKIIAIGIFFPVLLVGEEGMWTFDNPPVQQLLDSYEFTPTQEWLDHVRLSSVRFNSGGSGSFVSEKGLVLTNHHVARGTLQKISTSSMDYVSEGFYAQSQEDEVQCPDIELNVLVSMQNVTDQIASAVADTLDDREAFRTRQAIIARIEKEAKESTGYRSEVISLYQGGEYWLYQYKQYKDVRLVMAPEQQVAYFGGDDDNFTYPRYDLDMAFFRVYENGMPIHSPNYLKLNPDGAGEGELVFVSGHPGRTNRLYTADQLVYQRDVYLPMVLEYIHNRLELLHDYAQRGKEEARRALTATFYLENSKKAYTGMLQGLAAPSIEGKMKAEREFRDKVNQKPELSERYADAWDSVSAGIQISRQHAREWYYRKVIGSKMADWAVQAVFYQEEITKPDAERLEHYHESELEQFKFRFLSPAPLYKDFEIHQWAGGLKMSLKQLGTEDPFIRAALGDGEPDQFVQLLIENSSMDQVDFRTKLLEMDSLDFLEVDDPLIQWARKVVPILRVDREFERDHVDSKIRRAGEKIGKARFAVYGKTVFPDANFTLRLSYGSVKGYPMNGTRAPVLTTLYGLYDRSLSFGQKGDFSLPKRFWTRQKKLDLSTPVNFVCSCDIIGGNSGSPVINRNAELVGLVFDGNIESLPGRYYFDGSVNRTVSVHAAYIMETLEKLYHAGILAKELRK
jgi:hypothetical protein